MTIAYIYFNEKKNSTISIFENKMIEKGIHLFKHKIPLGISENDFLDILKSINNNSQIDFIYIEENSPFNLKYEFLKKKKIFDFNSF